MMDKKQFSDNVTTLLGEAALSCSHDYDEFTVYLDPEHLTKSVTLIRDHRSCLFQQFVDITAVDYPSRSHRFEVVYHFLSHVYNQRIRFKISVPENKPVPSIMSVFPAANWYEREVFDLYGIVFEGHTDLRRILTDYNFDGHPLRKDFPLTGYYEVRYDETDKKVVYEPVRLAQAYRPLDTLSPWEGMLHAMQEQQKLPGDEKAGEKK